MTQYWQIVVVLVVVLVCLLAALATVDVQAWMLFAATRLESHHILHWPELARHTFCERVLKLPTKRHLHGVLFKSKRHGQSSRDLVFCCRGIWQNVQHTGKRAALFLDQGWDVWMWDYAGSGKSRAASFVRETDLYDDALAVYANVSRDHASRGKPIIVWGMCIGGAIASHVAAHTPPHARRCC
jgi:predicted alpha/beta hydrolase